MMAVAWLLAAGGALMIALSMRRHRRDLGWAALAPPRARLLRSAGLALAATALAPVSAELGIEIGIVAWSMILSAGVVAAVTLVTWLTQRRNAR